MRANVVRQKTGVLLLSFSFNKSDGPPYEILPTDDNTFTECQSHFDRMFRFGEELFPLG